MSRRRAGQSRGPYYNLYTNTEVTDPLATLLAEARREAGLTQKALGVRLGVPRSALAMWERGTRPVPAYMYDRLVAELPASQAWPVESYWPRGSGVRQPALRLKSPETGG